MNQLSIIQTFKKHPILASGALVLGSVIAAKVAHYLPLQNLDEQYLSELYANEFKLPPLIIEYLSIDPYHTTIIPFGDDTILVADATQKKTFAITCPSVSSGGDDRPSIKQDPKCLIHRNPYVVPFTGSVIGNGTATVMPRSFIPMPFQGLPKSSKSITPSKGPNGIDLSNI